MSMKVEYYSGTILSDPDPKNLGRYKVHIPELLLRMTSSKGIWCRNHIHSYRVTNSSDGVHGSYTPLHANTNVTVAIINDDYLSAAVVRIISDDVTKDALPFNITDDCRDDFYLLMRTPKYDTIIAIAEDVPPIDIPPTTRTEPPNSFHLYHHNGETKIIIDADGIHINTAHNLSATVTGNSSIIINGSSGIHVGGNCDLTVGGVTNVTGGGDINVDAPNINLNSGAAAPGPIQGYDTFDPTKKELRLRKDDKKL